MENRNLAVRQHEQGNHCLAQGDLEGARRAFESAIEASPTFGGGYNGLGVVLHAERDLDGAVAAFRAALAANDRYGEAADNLGVVLRERGDIGEAKQWFLRATTLEPHNGRFLRHLADTAPIEAGDPLVGTLENVAAIAEQLPLEGRIEALFAYAKVLEDVGRCDEAFSTLERVNRLRRETIGYDETPMLQSFELLAQTFTSAFVEATSGCGDPSARPIFIVGMPRSGTTLVEALLASHPYVRSGGELTSFERNIAAMPAVSAGAPLGALCAALHALGSG